MSNRITNAETESVVTYPDPEKGPKAVRQPVTIECTEDGFESETETLEIHPGQGLVLDVQTPSRGVIALREPDERATDDGGPGTVSVINPNRPSISRSWRKILPRLDPSALSVDDLEAELEE